MRRLLRLQLFLGSVVVFALCGVAAAQQVADTLFVPDVRSPAHAPGKGPLVLVDAAHHNFHTATGRYGPFARVLRRDGYVVDSNSEPFSRDTLSRARVLVIANAIAAENVDEWVLPTPSAFDSAEIAAVADWVRGGGALFLIADHMPFPGAADALAEAIGVSMGNGFAMIDGGDDGKIQFSRATRTLADHPITRGRNAGERVDTLVSFTGQAFRLVNGGDALMTLQSNIVLLLPTVAWQFSKLTPAIGAGGMQQGAALKFGKGRVAVFGEAAMFSAQVNGPNRAPMGMNDPAAAQNAQFLLNVMHWLEGLL